MLAYTLPIPERYSHSELEAKSRAHIARFLHWRGIRDARRTERDAHQAAASSYISEVNEGVTSFDPDVYRLHADDVLSAFRAIKDAAITAYEVSRRRDAVENALAQFVHEVYARDPLPEYTSSTLGTATYVGQAEGGSDEWHALRQLGIGGSQILDAAGYEVDYSSHRLRRKSDNGRGYALEDLLHEKTLTPEERVDEGSDATQRGHLWEPVLLDAYAEFTGATVVIGKQTWRGPQPWQVVNVDGIVLDADGAPEGLVECKNSNNHKKWEKGVPVEFRAQVLYYLDATGLNYADLVARVNGDVTVHRIERGEPLDLRPSTQAGTLGTTHIEDIHTALAEVWEAVKEVKDDDFAKAFYRRARRKPVIEYNSNSMGKCTTNAWALLHYDMTREQVAAELKLRMKVYAQDRGVRKPDKDDKSRALDSAVRSLLRERFDPARLGVLCGIDGETAAIVNEANTMRPFMPELCSWIETGIAFMEGGEVTEVHHRQHGVDPRILRANGTGAQDVHNIAPEDVAGLVPLDIDLESLEWIRGHLARGDVIVAHNVEFESRFLSPLVFDACKSLPWLDTQWLTKHFVPITGVYDDNRLKSFVEAMGGEYIGAHRAHVDAKMMMEALREFLSREWLQ